MPDKFSAVTGAAAPLLRPNIDTDTIAPAHSEKEFGEKGASTLSRNLFAGWRYSEKGEEILDFILNRPEFREAKILLAGHNFGCGSSRESAVWMLRQWGIRCVIAPSFGEIFYNNCFKNGMLPLLLPESTVRELAEEAEPGAPRALFTVDLTANSLTTPSGRVVEFELPNFLRQGLLEGLDEIKLTLRREGEISEFVAQARRARPWAYFGR